MSLLRRDFCASLASLGLPARAIAANTNRTLRASDVVASPSTVHAFCENETAELKRDGQRWLANGISLSAETSEDRRLAVYVSSQQRRLLRLRLHWQGSLPQGRRFLGDAWERSYGDLAWRLLEPERIFPWYFLSGDGSSFTACGVRTNPGAFCFWQMDSSGITLWLDVRNGGSGVELGKRTLLAATIVADDYSTQTAFQATRKFCRRMADHGIVMPGPLYGGNNWYYAYGNSSADAIRADTERIASDDPSGETGHS